ncbi:MAG TPA: choice-of-anchor V domain-containing protein [Candidatus Eisenbacteria bacterium]|nr:choice-of-anchor V domain-containing protein [Candidatus Eisenbacteria bacterium]
MRRRIVRALVIAALAGGATLAFGYAEGPPVSRTGAIAVGGIPAEGLCTSCHNSFTNDVNDPNGQLQILDLPTSYSPGVTYPVRVRLGFLHPLTDTLLYHWGFELTCARADSGTGTGTFIVTPDLQVKPGTSTTAWKSRSYVEHTVNSIYEGDPGPVEWTFQWTAPPRNVGKIYFFAAGNAANGDMLPLGDHIFTADTAVAGDSTGNVGVPRIHPLGYATAMDPIFPNPAGKLCDMSFSIARAGIVDLGVFDLQGRRVYTVFHGWHEPGFDGKTWWVVRQDGRPAPNGVYFIRLMAPGLDRPLSRKVTISR